MDFEWWFNLLKVLGKTFFMILMCGVMKIKYLIFPEAKKRDFELMAKEKKVEITEENKKYWVGSDPSNLDNFLFTRKQIMAGFNAMFQDINKTAKLYGSAANPELFDADGNHLKLLSVARPNIPLVINFGSCT